MREKGDESIMGGGGVKLRDARPSCPEIYIAVTLEISQPLPDER